MAKTIKVRVLLDTQIDGIAYRCNDAAEFDEALAKKLAADGVADPNDAAVKEALKAGRLREHAKELTRAAKPAADE